MFCSAIAIVILSQFIKDKGQARSELLNHVKTPGWLSPLFGPQLQLPKRPGYDVEHAHELQCSNVHMPANGVRAEPIRSVPNDHALIGMQDNGPALKVITRLGKKNIANPIQQNNQHDHQTKTDIQSP
jgi:hypothetical protein